MIGLALVVVLQATARDALFAEGESLGRMATVTGICASIGYAADRETSRRLIAEYEGRVADAGLGPDTVMAGFRTGVAREKAELAIDAVVAGASNDQLRQYATETFARIKRRCRGVEAQYPGVLSDLDVGDRSADAKLAEVLASLD